MSNAITPKQPQLESAREWYPYYAGFSTAFVKQALAEHFADVKSLIDPWNGSGTTTSVGAAQGIKCFGLDINPAVTLIARARLTPLSVIDSLSPIAKEIVLASRREGGLHRELDPLHNWLRRPAVEALRALQRGIHRVVMGDDDLELEITRHPASTTSALPLLGAFYYAALFLVARDVLKPFRTSNPSWMSSPSSFRHRISPGPETIEALFETRVEYLAARLFLPSEFRSEGTSLRTGSVLNFRDFGRYEGCLTSPPYATRLDYVKMTLPELSILGLDSQQIQELRRMTTGTPVVKGVDVVADELASSLARDVVDAVRRHSSHGSSNYYAPWIENYFKSLQASFLVIDRAVIRGGAVGVVVQDSHYKSIHVDLQGIVTQMLGAKGRSLRSRTDFVVRHSIARMNPAARKYLPMRELRESLLVFS